MKNYKHARNPAFPGDLRKVDTYGGSDTIYKHRQLCYTVRAISRLSDLYFPPKLTKRESEILPLLLAGITRDEIASSLSVSPETVKLHTRNILSKFGATTVRDGFYDMNLYRTHYGVGGQGSDRFHNLFQCVYLILPGRQDVRVTNQLNITVM